MSFNPENSYSCHPFFGTRWVPVFFICLLSVFIFGFPGYLYVFFQGLKQSLIPLRLIYDYVRQKSVGCLNLLKFSDLFFLEPLYKYTTTTFTHNHFCLSGNCYMLFLLLLVWDSGSLGYEPKRDLFEIVYIEFVSCPSLLWISFHCLYLFWSLIRT